MSLSFRYIPAFQKTEQEVLPLDDNEDNDFEDQSDFEED